MLYNCIVQPVSYVLPEVRGRNAVVSESLRLVTDDNSLVSGMGSNHACLGRIESYVCLFV